MPIFPIVILSDPDPERSEGEWGVEGSAVAFDFDLLKPLLSTVMN
jgi:hypothetical protein